MATKQVSVPAPNFRVLEFHIIGTSPLVIHKVSKETIDAMHNKQAEGDKLGRKTTKKPKDFQAQYEGAIRRLKDGREGFHAGGFRSALIRAGNLVGVEMTMGRRVIFVFCDGYDVDDAAPLVLITEGKPRYFETTVRIGQGILDLRARPLWEPGWKATVRLKYDADILNEQDVASLVVRAGLQNGLHEGRAFSPKSGGCGWGEFELDKEYHGKE